MIANAAITSRYFHEFNVIINAFLGSDIVSLGIASGKHTMKDASTNGVISSGRLNGSPFQPSGLKSLQV